MGTTHDLTLRPNSDTLTTLERVGVAALVGIAIAGAMSGVVYAGGDSTFTAPVTWLNNALTGSLGRTIALASLAVGLGVGVVKQSVMSVVVGTAIALSASVGPGVLNGILAATL